MNPLYAKIEVNMNPSFEDIFLVDAESGEKFVMPQEDAGFSIGWQTQKEADIETAARKAEGIKAIGLKFEEMMDSGLRFEEVIDILEGD